MYFDAHIIFNTFRSRGVFMFVLCLMILCSVRPSFAAEAEATLQAELQTILLLRQLVSSANMVS